MEEKLKLAGHSDDVTGFEILPHKLLSNSKGEEEIEVLSCGLDGRLLSSSVQFPASQVHHSTIMTSRYPLYSVSLVSLHPSSSDSTPMTHHVCAVGGQDKKISFYYKVCSASERTQWNFLLSIPFSCLWVKLRIEKKEEEAERERKRKKGKVESKLQTLQVFFATLQNTSTVMLQNLSLRVDGLVVTLEQGPIHQFQPLPHSPVRTISFGSTENQFFTGSDEGIVRKWNIDDSSSTLVGSHQNDVISLISLVSKDGKAKLITSGKDREIRIWIENTVKRSSSLSSSSSTTFTIASFPCSFVPRCLQVIGWREKSYLLVGGGDGSLTIWNFLSDNEIEMVHKSVVISSGPVSSVSYWTDEQGVLGLFCAGADHQVHFLQIKNL
eukprot:TRINITY_DN7195_c0_g1_i1.p1 TRINITY_DN7195_c0_g1~~TRINITY_DN7195_c0_g1_i1.p1  ORF type:complete len:390 (-),score=94.49 TRINITY_DN7195_c0_g1_i1:3-1148(-)